MRNVAHGTEPSFATRFIHENDLEDEPTSVGPTRRGVALRVRLIPYNDSTVEAAYMEAQYRNEANALYGSGEVERAEQVIRLGHESVERYLREQRLESRVYQEISYSSVYFRDSAERLERTDRDIREGIVSPIPSPHMQGYFYSGLRGKSRRVERVDVSNSSYL